MRPLRLEMTAFGSYAEHTVVPFADLDRGLYLVTGDTGAGKTTIFDAIVFALYGKASGKDRSAEMMHSDLTEKSEDTVVELIFSQAGRTCTVTRRIHFPKKRKAAGGYGDAEIQATLTGEGLDPVEGATRVSAACEALLGLNAEQFRKIVMLAQGEFRDFLKADSEKKTEILGKLFDSAPYVWYQKLLDAARKQLEQVRAADRERLRLVLEHQLVLPPEADPACFTPGAPGLLEALDGLIRREEADRVACTDALKDKQAARDRLLVRQESARTLNAELDRLDRTKQRVAELDALAGIMQDRQKQWTLAELALHRAQPALRRAAEAAAARQSAEALCAQLRDKLTVQTTLHEEAAAALAGGSRLRDRLRELDAALGTMQGQLALFDELERQQVAAKTATEARERLDGALEALAEQQAAQEQERMTLRQRLNALEGTDAALERCRQDAARTGDALAAFAGERGFAYWLGWMRTRDAQIARAAAALEAQTAAYLQARNHVEALNQRFIAGQAGLLAERVRAVLRTGQTASCPVCGQAVCTAQQNGLVPLPADTPSEEAVKAAQAEVKARETAWNAAKDRLNEQQARQQSNRERLVTQVRAYRPDCESWETLDAPGWLEAVTESLRTEDANAAAALRSAARQQREQTALREALNALEVQAKQLQTEAEQTRMAREQEAGRAAAAVGQCHALQNQLAYESRVEAERLRTNWQAEALRLRTELDALTASEKSAAEQAASLRGRLESAARTCSDRQAEAELAAAVCEAALAETGFGNEDVVRSALAPMGQTDGEQWLRTEQAALLSYAHERETCAAQATELTEKTAGRTRADLNTLETDFAVVDAACKALETQLRALDGTYNAHVRVRAQAADALAALAATDGAWATLDRLGGFAAGTAGQGGKLSFARYVMGAVFREILELANRRLDVISGGRYELVHKAEADRASAKAGLEIDILDLSTGKRRPSASLSGGEAFYTSLALALGLSDVVQSHAGGMRLEALFIDEGFGTLDDDMLDNALAVLNGLTQGDRLVGIISHVDKLDASIPRKIVVKKGPRGSSLSLVL